MKVKITRDWGPEYALEHFRVSVSLDRETAANLHLKPAMVQDICEDVARYIREEWVPEDTPEYSGETDAYEATVLTLQDPHYVDVDHFAAEASNYFGKLLSKGHPEFV